MSMFPLLPGTFYQPDPNDPPVPPDQVRVRSVKVTPRPDGKRVLVEVELTPFEKRPHVEIALLDPQERVVASLSVVEPVLPVLEFTLHIKTPQWDAPYRVRISVQYPEWEFRIPKEGEDWELPPMKEVHKYEQAFRLEPPLFDEPEETPPTP